MPWSRLSLYWVDTVSHPLLHGTNGSGSTLAQRLSQLQNPTTLKAGRQGEVVRKDGIPSVKQVRYGCCRKGKSISIRYGVFPPKNRGGFGPPKWMVKKIKTPIKMDDLGVPLFLETPI